MALVPASTPVGWILERLTVTAQAVETMGLRNRKGHMPKQTSKPSPSSESGSSPSELGARIIRYIQAGYSGLYLVSPEEQRVEGEIKAVVDNINHNRAEADRYQLCYWSVVDGLINTHTKQVHSANEPIEVLQAISEHKDKAVFLLKDYHLFLEET